MAMAIDKLTPVQQDRLFHLDSLRQEQEEAAARVRALRGMYDGAFPVMLTQRQTEYLGPLLDQPDFGFAHNLVRSVIDTLRERLSVTGIAVEGAADADPGTPEATVSAALWEWWTKARLDSEQIRLYRRSLRDGLAYIMVDFDQETARPRFTQHHVDAGWTDPGILLHRDPSDANKVLYATRYFTTFDPLTPGATGKRRKTVYLPDQIRKYSEERDGWQPVMDPGDASWPLPWVDRRGDPLGIPVVEFANPGGSEVAQIIGLQNALNKAWLDLLAAADTSGFPLIAIEYEEAALAVAPPDDEDATDSSIRLSPGRAIEVDRARVHRLEAANLDQMIGVIRYIVQAISGVSRTPAYYLEPVGGSNVPSGEALKQLESGLVRRAEERQLVFGQAWEDVFALAYRINGAFGPSLPEMVDMSIRVEWQDANVRNELAEAQVAEAHQRLGVPQAELWRRMGYTPEQIEGFKASQRADDAAKVAAVTAALRVDQMRPAAQNGKNITAAPSNANSNGTVRAQGGQNGRANSVVAR